MQVFIETGLGHGRRVPNNEASSKVAKLLKQPAKGKCLGRLVLSNQADRVIKRMPILRALFLYR